MMTPEVNIVGTKNISGEPVFEVANVRRFLKSHSLEVYKIMSLSCP